MKLRSIRSMVLTAVTLAIVVSTLSGCVVVPARGYGYYEPHMYHGWGGGYR